MVGTAKPPTCSRCGARRIDEYTFYGCPDGSSSRQHRHWVCVMCEFEFVHDLGCLAIQAAWSHRQGANRSTLRGAQVGLTTPALNLPGINGPLQSGHNWEPDILKLSGV